MSSSPLFQPFSVGGLELKNRVVMTALSRSRSIPDAVPTALNAEYYAQRAKGGAGFIISEGAFTSPQGCVFMIVACVE